MLKERNQTQKDTVNTLQLKTIRNIAVAEHVELITHLSKGRHTSWEMQDVSVRVLERTFMTQG